MRCTNASISSTCKRSSQGVMYVLHSGAAKTKQRRMKAQSAAQQLCKASLPSSSMRRETHLAQSISAAGTHLRGVLQCCHKRRQHQRQQPDKARPAGPAAAAAATLKTGAVRLDMRGLLLLWVAALGSCCWPRLWLFLWAAPLHPNATLPHSPRHPPAAPANPPPATRQTGLHLCAALPHLSNACGSLEARFSTPTSRCCTYIGAAAMERAPLLYSARQSAKWGPLHLGRRAGSVSNAGWSGERHGDMCRTAIDSGPDRR